MSDLSLTQITDTLNAEFSAEGRTLIFWFDADASFEADVDELRLRNAKVYHLRQDEQFRAKVCFEHEDTRTNYLVYAPYPKPAPAENLLADTIHYSREFHADRISLMMLELNIDERWRGTLNKYKKFFNSKNTEDFKKLDISDYDEDSIELGIMAVLCGCAVPRFDEILRRVLTDGGLEDNKYLAVFARYDLLDSFWKQCAQNFGYADQRKTLEGLLCALFVTAMQRNIHGVDLPPEWTPFVSFRSGNIIAFIDELMNNVQYSKKFDEYSEYVCRALNIDDWLSGLEPADIAGCILFPRVDELLIAHLTQRLVNEDAGAKLGDETIPQLCERRGKTHFGKERVHEYEALRAAHWLIAEPAITMRSNMKDIVKAYTGHDFEADRAYRNFYMHYDSVDDNTSLEALRELVERIYQSKFLEPLCASFALAYARGGDTGLEPQSAFYMCHIHGLKYRVAVIISDALRYEVAVSLKERLELDEKCNVRITAMESMLPSITRTGMAALLPQRSLQLSADGRSVLADAQPTIDLAQREAILRRTAPNSLALQFDELNDMKTDAFREVFKGQDVIYIYHNQIDARGDKANTQHEVFKACDEAVDEIFVMIKKLNDASVSHILVTADHGFLYRHDKLGESDKIGDIPNASHRYAISDAPLSRDGVISIPLRRSFGGKDERFINCPVGDDLFKAPGGLNYVHGGCSPQEMIVPLLAIRTERYHQETTYAMIDLLTTSRGRRITNLITMLDFVQTEPVSDRVKAADYKVYFIDDAGTHVSNELICHADKSDADVGKRNIRLYFNFRNQHYDPTRVYKLKVEYCEKEDDKKDNKKSDKKGDRNKGNNRTVKPSPKEYDFTIDIAFSNDFGFRL